MAIPEFIIFKEGDGPIISEGSVLLQDLVDSGSESSKRFSGLVRSYISRELSNILDMERGEVVSSSYDAYLRNLLVRFTDVGKLALFEEKFYSLNYFLANSIARRVVALKYSPGDILPDQEYYIKENPKRNTVRKTTRKPIDIARSSREFQIRVKIGNVTDDLFKEPLETLVDDFFMSSDDLSRKIDV